MRLDLTDEETRALLNLLVETIEADKFPMGAARPDIARHPCQVRADGSAATAARAAAHTRGARPGTCAALSAAASAVIFEAAFRCLTQGPVKSPPPSGRVPAQRSVRGAAKLKNRA
jgi:hypothetical protein